LSVNVVLAHYRGVYAMKPRNKINLSRLSHCYKMTYVFDNISYVYFSGAVKLKFEAETDS